MQEAAGLEHPRFERDDLGTGVGAEWTLLGVAVSAIVDVLTESSADQAGADSVTADAVGASSAGAEPGIRR